MGFYFEKKESVRNAVRRLGIGRIGKSLRCLDRGDEFEAIHQVRKEIKKLRALLRLVRDKIPRRDYRRGLKALREAAAPLAASRDANVKLQSLDTLVDRYRKQVSPGPFKRFHDQLEQVCRTEAERFRAGRSEQKARAALLKLAEWMAELRVDGKGWSAIAAGIEAGYRAGRKGWRAAARDPSANGLHRWRKRVKAQWHQLCLLRRVWPEHLRKLSAELEKLGDDLGEDHDLSVLRQAVMRAQRRQVPVSTARALARLIDLRRAELASAALELGTHVYADKPRFFRRHLRRRWKSWRRD